MPVSRKAGDIAGFADLLTIAFRKRGWRVPLAFRHPGGDARLQVKTGSGTLLVELRVASEGRSDRLIPALSQAILEAQTGAREKAEVPVAVIASSHIPLSVAVRLQDFAARHAPGVGVGVIDAEGLRLFRGPGLDGLDSPPAQSPLKRTISPKRPVGLFSDLNQWMLKILLGQSLPTEMISVPRGPVVNASRLAALAKVSVMSATRLVNQLEEEGFLERYTDRLQLFRVTDLLERWREAAQGSGNLVRIKARFLVPLEGKQFLEGVAAAAGAQHRCCVGLFAAADALGLGFVRGVPPWLYVERLDSSVLKQLGLTIGSSERPPDVYVRIPKDKESTFRAATTRHGLPVSDILQVWLDCSRDPARGREQADEIWRRVLEPAFAGRKPARSKR